MAEVDRFFDEETRAIAVESGAIARRAAEKLRDDVQRQIKENFKNPSAAFMRGVKVYDADDGSGSYVRLSPILSAHAEPVEIKGNPNLWILLPDGARLGFKRIDKGFNWDVLKRRYGTKLSFVAVADGHIVLYRSPQGVKPIYKIQSVVKSKQRIKFYEKAEEIAANINE